MYPRQFVPLHGRVVAYRLLPGDTSQVPVLFLHGIGASGDTWLDIPEELSDNGVSSIVVDLPGHGESSRGAGDYSLGAMAGTLRDLLDYLNVERVHIVGHSLGGGVAMQFAYLFPDRVDSLTLVSSGGLGEETFAGLRAATLPGSNIALKVAINERTVRGAAWVGRRLARMGFYPHVLSPRSLDTVSWLAEEDRRVAFLATLRSVVGVKGQRVSALDKLHLLEERRILIVWGEKDPMIPLKHGENAHAMLTGSIFAVFPASGHEPHVDDPRRFARLLLSHVREPITA